jgi:hypothetical protein
MEPGKAGIEGLFKQAQGSWSYVPTTTPHLDFEIFRERDQRRDFSDENTSPIHH